MSTLITYLAHWVIVNCALLLALLTIIGIWARVAEILRDRAVRGRARRVLRQPRVLKIMREAVTLRIDAQSDSEAADKLTGMRDQ